MANSLLETCNNWQIQRAEILSRNPDMAMTIDNLDTWICPYISRHLLSLNPLQARCRRYSRGER